jgi:ABC-type transport system involved in multi-copper enzyme maturation permease subunit
MNKRGTVLESMVLAAGVPMLMSGLLIFGSLGFVLLLGVFYAMLVQNFALGVVCGLVLFTPAILGVTWAPLAWTAVIRERLATRPLSEEAAVSVTR